jgi:hypothetical protein
VLEKLGANVLNRSSKSRSPGWSLKLGDHFLLQMPYIDYPIEKEV